MMGSWRLSGVLVVLAIQAPVAFAQLAPMSAAPQKAQAVALQRQAAEPSAEAANPDQRPAPDEALARGAIVKPGEAISRRTAFSNAAQASHSN
jgi:hypothetical protein